MLRPRHARPLTRRGEVSLAALVVVAAGVAAALLTQGGSAPPLKSVPAATLPHSRDQYLRLAEQGVSQTSKWWDRQSGWYFETLANHKARPLATIWDTNGLFEALDEIAIADPTRHNRAAVKSFANRSQGYWNPDLRPQPGFSPYLGDRGRHQETYYDDNGWLGLAFLDADLATGSRRYLHDAERAFSFIAAGGWDSAGGGGMWWTNVHQWRSGEALAADADLAARLYQATHRATYLEHARTYIGWANAHLRQPHGVYIRTASHPYGSLAYRSTTASATSSTRTPAGAAMVKGRGCAGAGRCAVRAGTGPACTAARHCTIRGPHTNPHPGKPVMVPMPHDGEGAMMSAMVALCQATHHHSWCSEAQRLARAAMIWLAPFDDGPQYDSILLRGFLDLYAVDHEARWYRFAADLAAFVLKKARTSTGVYLLGWDGAGVPGALPGMLRTDAANVGVLADLATVSPPAR